MACLNVRNLSQQTLLGMTADTDVGTFLNKMPLTQWEIISFNPARYEACIKIYQIFNQAEIQSYITELRVQLAAATDSATRLSIQSAILQRQNQLNNPPFITITVTIPPP